MNKNTNILGKLILCALLVYSGAFIFSSNASAAWGLITQELMERGKGHYDEGRYEEAIQAFSKVLLRNPGQEEALSYLKKMGLDGGIYGANKKPLTDKVFQLNEEVLSYQQELQSLEGENQVQKEYGEQLKERLQDSIAQKKAEKDQLIGANQELRAVATMKIKEQQKYISELENLKDNQREDLTRLNSDLAQTQEKLRQGESEITEKSEVLEELERKYEKGLQLSGEELKGLRLAYNKKLAAMEKDRNVLEKEVFETRDDHREKMQQYRKALMDIEAKLETEKNLSTAKSYRIAQQENRYLNLKKQIDNLLEERKLLFKQAGDLKGQIVKLNQEKTFRQATDEKVSQPSREKFIERIYKQDEEITDLKSRLVEMLNNVDNLKSEGAETNQKEILELQRQVAKLKRGIELKEKDLEFAEGQKGVLQERIDEYQERLDIVEGMIKDKEARILFLEEQLGADVYSDN